MNRIETINAIAERTDITKADVTRVLDTFMETTTKALKKGDQVQFAGFGTFKVTKRAARNGRNPLTGAAMKIPSRKVVKFKVGSKLAEAIR